MNLLADATLLDPWFKKHAFVQDKYAEEVVSRVVGAALTEARSLRPAQRKRRLTHLSVLPLSQRLQFGLTLRGGFLQ